MTMLEWGITVMLIYVIVVVIIITVVVAIIFVVIYAHQRLFEYISTSLKSVPDCIA